MKLKYFGTAAAEGIPAFTCNCKVCENARKVGGKELRLRTQALINDDLLIDFPPDAMYFSMRYAVDYAKVKDCVISHNHPDHLCATEIEYFGKNFVANGVNHPLNFYAGKSGYDGINNIYNDNLKGRINVFLAEKFVPFTTTAGYRVLPLPANHRESTTPFIYLIERDGKRILWAHDTGVFYDKTLEVLKTVGHIDLISLDCCAGFLTGWKDSHMGIDGCLDMLDKLESFGIVDKSTVKVLNHFSHNGKATHAQMESFLKDKNIVVSYDGMEIEF